MVAPPAGAEQTTAKVAYTLARMSQAALRALPALRALTAPRLVRTQALGFLDGDHRA